MTDPQDRKQAILDAVALLAEDLVDADCGFGRSVRVPDPSPPLGTIAATIAAKEIAIEDIVEAFSSALRRHYEGEQPLESRVRVAQQGLADEVLVMACEGGLSCLPERLRKHALALGYEES